MYRYKWRDSFRKETSIVAVFHAYHCDIKERRGNVRANNFENFAWRVGARLDGRTGIAVSFFKKMSRYKF